MNRPVFPGKIVVADPAPMPYQAEDFIDERDQPVVSVRAVCRHGGPVPCFDDLCHGTSTTLCGLEEGFDFCHHGNLPDSCGDCDGERDDW